MVRMLCHSPRHYIGHYSKPRLTMKENSSIPIRTGTTALFGAAFLMATSAIGPGFLTQTTVFTQQLGASFGFVILASIVIDIAVQLNIWRVIVVPRKRAQDIANALLPGL